MVGKRRGRGWYAGAEALRLVGVGEQQGDDVFADSLILIGAVAVRVGDTFFIKGNADNIRLRVGTLTLAAEGHSLACGFGDRAFCKVVSAALEDLGSREPAYLSFRKTWEPFIHHYWTIITIKNDGGTRWYLFWFKHKFWHHDFPSLTANLITIFRLRILLLANHDCSNACDDAPHLYRRNKAAGEPANKSALLIHYF